MIRVEISFYMYMIIMFWLATVVMMHIPYDFRQKPSPLRTPKASPQRVAVAGQGTQGVLGSGYVVWSGQLSSKGTFLCEVELVSYTSPAKPARM